MCSLVMKIKNNIKNENHLILLIKLAQNLLLINNNKKFNKKNTNKNKNN